MIHTIVLAAGASTRMGGAGPKALLKLEDGRTFLAAIAQAAREAGSANVTAVVGPPHGDAIRRALPPGVGALVNPRPERGMLSSVQTALSSLPRGVTALLVWPVDMPLVKAETVRAILAAAPGKTVVPTHKDKGGHPVRIPQRRFSELSALAADATLKDLIDAAPADVVRLPVEDPGVLIDFDTPDDLKKKR
jgi:molybdenum cofactor cytidylyltransferase